MEKTTKKMPWFSAKWWVWLFFAFQCVAIFLSVVPSILAKFGIEYDLAGVGFDTDMIGWFWMATITIYTGSQVIEHIFISRNLEIGEYDLGDLSKMRRMIIATYILTICLYIVNIIFAAGLGVDSYIAAIGASTIAYTAGIKGIKTAGEISTN